MFLLLVIFSALSFFFYGIGCLTLSMMEHEFRRYGLNAYRNLTGVLQIAAAAGLLIGFQEPAIGMIASGGLALQMLLAVGVRIKIKDTLFQTMPALTYCLINGYLFYIFWQKISS